MINAEGGGGGNRPWSSAAALAGLSTTVSCHLQLGPACRQRCPASVCWVTNISLRRSSLLWGSSSPPPWPTCLLSQQGRPQECEQSTPGRLAPHCAPRLLVHASKCRPTNYFRSASRPLMRPKGIWWRSSLTCPRLFPLNKPSLVMERGGAGNVEKGAGWINIQITLWLCSSAIRPAYGLWSRWDDPSSACGFLGRKETRFVALSGKTPPPFFFPSQAPDCVRRHTVGI